MKNIFLFTVILIFQSCIPDKNKNLEEYFASHYNFEIDESQLLRDSLTRTCREWTELTKEKYLINTKLAPAWEVKEINSNECSVLLVHENQWVPHSPAYFIEEPPLIVINVDYLRLLYDNDEKKIGEAFGFLIGHEFAHFLIHTFPLQMPDLVIHSDLENNVKFLKFYNDFYFLGKQEFDSPGSGYAMHYKDHSENKLSIYLYDHNFDNIQNGINDINIQRELNYSTSVIESIGGKKISDFIIPKEFNDFFLYKAYSSYPINEEEQNGTTAVFIAGLNNKFVKLRFSVLKEKLSEDDIRQIKYVLSTFLNQRKE